MDVLEKVRICLLMRIIGLHGEDKQTKAISSRMMFSSKEGATRSYSLREETTN
jgi:hypothetical protein